jgi:hypothetical protein
VANPHSTQLGHVLDTGSGISTLYTVPAAKRTILKSIVAQNYNAAANVLTVSVWSGSTELFQWAYYLAANPGNGDSVLSLPWVVLNTGQLLKVQTLHASLTVVASGAELAA